MAATGFALSLCATALMLHGAEGLCAQAGAASPSPTLVTLRVAAVDAEPLLGYLAGRLGSGGESRIGDRACARRTIDERRETLYFDDANMSLLDSGRAVRFERRLQPDGKLVADAVHARLGAAPIAILDGLDPGASTRSDTLPHFEDLFAPEGRAPRLARLVEHGLDPAGLRASMRLQVKTVGFALGDARGDAVTFTIRRVSCRSADLELQWHELQAEAPPSGHDADDAAAVEFRDAVLAELAAASPRLVRDVNDDYRRSFARLQAATWLPLRTLHSLGLTPLAAKVGSLLAASTLFGAVSALLAIRRLRRTAAQPGADVSRR